jgi:hypothetical protein
MGLIVAMKKHYNYKTIKIKTQWNIIIMSM